MSATRPVSPSLNISLLNRLRAAQGDFVALAELGDEPGQVRTDLDALIAFGFAIEQHPYLGVGYAGPSRRLCPDQIEHELAPKWVGRRIAVWNQVGSTNDVAARACVSAANDGLVVLAEDQTEGRGRRGRTWIAPPRTSILMSIVLFPPRFLDPDGADAPLGRAWLTALAAVATAEVVDAWTGRDATIKWPNDIRVGGKKIAGILVERARAPSPREPGADSGWASVIGIGLNANLDREAFPPELRSLATSLQIERDGAIVDRSALARDLITRLDRWYDISRTRGPGPINDGWRARGECIGQVVIVLTPAGELVGRLVDIDFARGLVLDRNLDNRPESSPAPIRDLVRVPLAAILALTPAPSP